MIPELHADDLDKEIPASAMRQIAWSRKVLGVQAYESALLLARETVRRKQDALQRDRQERAKRLADYCESLQRGSQHD